MIRQTLILLMAVITNTQPLHERAGGPSATAIPDNCTITNPLPHAGCEEAITSGYQLASEFGIAHLIYQAYYDSPLSGDDIWKQCSEQCYGFGMPGTCKTVLVASNVTTPVGWLDTPGESLSPTACLMYDEYASPDDFEPAATGEYVDERAGNLYCGL